MSLLNPRKLSLTGLALALAASLSACGFQPVYGPDGNGTELQNNVTFPAPESFATKTPEDSYFLVRNLEERLGRTSTGAYRVDLALTTQEVGQAFTVDGEITRYSLLGKADYSLFRAADGKVLASGRVENFTGYSAAGTTVQTLASENDAHERLMRILADQIVIRLLVTDLSKSADAS